MPEPRRPTPGGPRWQDDHEGRQRRAGRAWLASRSGTVTPTVRVSPRRGRPPPRCDHGRAWDYQLAEQRRRLGFTQAGLAEIMGVTPGLVSQIEHGEVSTVEALASYIVALGGKLELIADIGGHL